MEINGNLENLDLEMDRLIKAMKNYPPMDGRDHTSIQDEDAGMRSGKVSELTVVAKLKPGGLARMQKLVEMKETNPIFNSIVSCVGTIHDIRFCLIENNTKMLFASTFDGTWDAYINDFATKIPELLDFIFSALEGWPGIHSPAVKDYIKSVQTTASVWFVSHPNLTINDITRHEKIVKGLDKVLDAASLIH